jgi:hypothetical protein
MLNMFAVSTYHLSLIVFEIKDEKYSNFDEKRAITPRWVIRFTSKLLILILFVLYFKNYLEIDIKFKLQKCAACQDLPTLQF